MVITNQTTQVIGWIKYVSRLNQEKNSFYAILYTNDLFEIVLKGFDVNIYQQIKLYSIIQLDNVIVRISQGKKSLSIDELEIYTNEKTVINTIYEKVFIQPKIDYDLSINRYNSVVVKILSFKIDKDCCDFVVGHGSITFVIRLLNVFYNRLNITPDREFLEENFLYYDYLFVDLQFMQQTGPILKFMPQSQCYNLIDQHFNPLPMKDYLNYDINQINKSYFQVLKNPTLNLAQSKKIILGKFNIVTDISDLIRYTCTYCKQFNTDCEGCRKPSYQGYCDFTSDKESFRALMSEQFIQQWTGIHATKYHCLPTVQKIKLISLTKEIVAEAIIKAKNIILNRILYTNTQDIIQFQMSLIQ